MVEEPRGKAAGSKATGVADLSDSKGPMNTLSNDHVRRIRTPPRRNIVAALTATLALVFGVVIPASPMSATDTASAATNAATLLATEETWTTSRTPSKVHGQLPYVSMTAAQDRTFIKFDGSALSGKKITSAKLVLRAATTQATKPGVQVYAAPASWSEKTLTDANRPADRNVRLNTVSPQVRAGQTVTVPLKDLSTISTEGSFAFRVRYSQKNVGSTFIGTGSRAPQLVVTFDNGVPAPTKPSQPVKSVAKPTSSVDKPTPGAKKVFSAKKVFAHYFPPYPLSFDNKPAARDHYTRHYLTVNGEGGIHAAYGGLLRDRPLPVAPSSSSTWQVDNLRTEIRQAKTAGIDGFMVNIMSISGMNWTATMNLFTAAEKEDFSIVPMIDGTAGVSRLTPARVATSLASLYKSPAAFKIGTDYLLSSFKAEGPGVNWWKQIINLLETKHGMPVSFQAVFLSTSAANMSSFAPISDSFGNWGARSASAINKLPDYDVKAEKYGMHWMEPVAPQDMRPRSGVYAEAGNTEALRAGWSKAIRDDADYVNMVTWNDYSESTHFAPSVGHGTAFLEISRYYSDWFHNGSAPKITTDELFLTHRVQFADAVSTKQQKSVRPTLSGSAGKARDTVEALVFLTAPATVQMTVGGVTSTFKAPAGVSAFTAPLRVGTVQAQIIRDGAAVRMAESPYKVVAKPSVQDLQYYAVTGK